MRWQTGPKTKSHDAKPGSIAACTPTGVSYGFDRASRHEVLDFSYESYNVQFGHGVFGHLNRNPNPRLGLNAIPAEPSFQC